MMQVKMCFVDARETTIFAQKEKYISVECDMFDECCFQTYRFRRHWFSCRNSWDIGVGTIDRSAGWSCVTFIFIGSLPDKRVGDIVEQSSHICKNNHHLENNEKRKQLPFCFTSYALVGQREKWNVHVFVLEIPRAELASTMAMCGTAMYDQVV